MEDSFLMIDEVLVPQVCFLGAEGANPDRQ